MQPEQMAHKLLQFEQPGNEKIIIWKKRDVCVYLPFHCFWLH